MRTPLPVSRASAEHYTWGNGCDGWHLVRADGLSVIQERMPPGATEVRHRHARARQFFFVLAGALTIEIDGRTHRIEAQAGIEVAPGLAHEVRNDSPHGVDFLVVSQPPSHGDREGVPLTARAADGRMFP